MFPIGHLALGYLSVALFRVGRRRPLPTGWTLAAALVGSQLPDLIDKPLAYYGVLVSGRSLGHSLLVMLPALVALVGVGYRLGYGEHATALVVATLSHYLGDTSRALLAGDWGSMQFLLWPLFPATDYAADSVPPWVRVLESLGDPRYNLQYALAVVAFGIWLVNRLDNRRARAER
ncbi:MULTISPECIES: metal-dependent hydrolase [unclassified Haloferax]|uniref:metal-dependent hydrolase n=1 Tax=Haloferax TaxID=2251 RepID=UPI0002B11E90|nr:MULTISPECIES: metal-dependent hydrolase [unclassified Haloferax]ELZ55710.1 putative membrane-bound metal-dependent hydrolase [Haloferax sp. ATCC BAA-646]ELZ67750.1 putative membrane-bound metal-dependent hydrolase [Haloferax sp. ATCC BAA-645]ELZ68321.1 putative membrane-bound metal-dependent hydrolase [Haloferax sp. ATCC BAA-644]